jgi:serine phosphatase RsbU (regulator of sigma subunit)/anti-sigma regulatory factor (Ser/Thr protein kinase)/anti-anti-sigma regulatory factor
LRAELLHQLPILPVLFLGPDRIAAATNQALVDFYDGYSPMGRALRDTLVGLEDQGMVEMYDRALNGETVRYDRTRWVLVTPEGQEQEVWLNHLAMPFRDRDGEIVGAIAMAIDITPEVRRQQEEADAARDLSRRYQRATDVIAEVQRALLPARLPVLPAVDVAATYVIGGAEQAAGGHGVDASAVMAQLRAVTLERLDAGVSPSDVVAALDRFVRVLPAARGATVCILRFDTITGEFEFCSAGHPPPLVVDTRIGSRYAASDSQGPIGERATRRSIQDHLEPGAVLLLYSDGIIERPGIAATTGTVELVHAAELAVADRLLPAFSSPSAVERATSQVLERLTRLTGSLDDITMLALQRVEPLAPLHHRAVITHSGSAGMRTALRSWFGLDRIDPHALFELDQIVTELCENSIQHGYGGQPGTVTLDAALATDGLLTLTVSDHGRWRPEPDTASRGIGLAVVQRLAEKLTVVVDDGTRVVVDYRPWKLALNTPATAPKGAHGVADVYLRPLDGVPTLVVSGPVDASVIEQLAAELALCTAPGARDFTIDLNDVTLLSSQAIRTIRRSLCHAENAGITATIHSRPGSVAQQVLHLAAIPTSAPG